MRYSLSHIALASVAAAFLAAPFLPDDFLPDVLFAPGSSALPQIVENGANAASNLFISSANADEAPPQAIDFDSLVYIDEKPYQITHDGSVSTEPVSSHTVRKIAFGRTTQVRIVKTLSGGYSTDGLVSNHVLYPGIKVTPGKVSGPAAAANPAMWWRTGFGWMALPSDMSSSLITMGPVNGGGHFVTSGGTTCISAPTFATCS